MAEMDKLGDILEVPEPGDLGVVGNGREGRRQNTCRISGLGTWRAGALLSRKVGNGPCGPRLISASTLTSDPLLQCVESV